MLDCSGELLHEGHDCGPSDTFAISAESSFIIICASQ